MKKNMKAIVLAAGKGTRLQTENCDLPKVMRLANGKPLLHYVLESIGFIAPEDTVIVVGYQKQYVMEGFPGYVFAEQAQQLGTGHAVMCAAEALGDYDGPVLVCCGDMPLLKRSTYEAMAEAYDKEDCACVILTGTTDLPLPYGRVLRDENGAYLRIVEEKDCTPAQLAITELNAGVYVFDAKTLFACLGELKNENAQGEYYLTDVPEIMMKKGCRVVACRQELGKQIIGVNTPAQLAQTEAILREETR